MAKRSIGDIEKIWSNVEAVKKASDKVIGIGPFGVGLDGLLTWIPVVGASYSVLAGGWLFIQGVRARAAPGTLARMAGYVLLDMATSEVPLVGDAVDFFFRGHLMAAKALQKDIETTHWVEASGREARENGDHLRHLEEARRHKRRRVVYLHD